MVEALACGRPIVGTNIGGIPELVKETSGLLIPTQDAAALRTALDKALEAKWDNTEWPATSTRSWETVAEATWKVCEEAASRS